MPDTKYQILKKNNQRLRVDICGAVQGVGFRPFVYRLADELGLAGWVGNSLQGVVVEAEGEHDRLEEFLQRLQDEKPNVASIQSCQYRFLDVVGYQGFAIRESDVSGEKTAFVLPDIATCPQCLSEIFDPNNRRYLYPFTNCAHCGPRYSIIEGLPYDRPNTSMKKFEMCPDCQEEYENPQDRRFHAQPNACPACGPHVELWDAEGKVFCARQDAVARTVEAVQQGKIVAVKGLGGFHLVCDAADEQSVERLRQRKHREEKPFAVMFPSVEAVLKYCEVSALEQSLLNSPECPVVLLKKRKGLKGIAMAVAPGNPCLGAMLPYTPLHHILMKELGSPIVATSANLSDEPICIDEREAVGRLRGIADVFLVHNRPVVRHVDDSVVREVAGRPMVLRRARGYAPLGVAVNGGGESVLAVGAHLKNTVALKVGGNVFVSQHIGDLETKQACAAFEGAAGDLENLYETSAQHVACDQHPGYVSTAKAMERDVPVTQVQHHHAHIVSCMAENELQGPVLGVAWDGTGFGQDGTVWGGEFLKATRKDFVRAGHLRTFKLPGGEAAIKEPRRSAMGLLYEIFGQEAFTFKDLACVRAFDSKEAEVVKRMLQKGINSPVTSSVGRLFDAVASLVGLQQKPAFEGQAAMALEYVLEYVLLKENVAEVYPFEVSGPDQLLGQGADSSLPGLAGRDSKKSAPRGTFGMPGSPGAKYLNRFVVDWALMVKEIIADLHCGVNVGKISCKFHNTLVEMIIAVAKEVGEEKVVLSGGCFQNKYLTERAVARLREEGFIPYWHQLFPPNDGGISLGQAICCEQRLRTTNNVQVH
ncbi:MAG: carbamoyltransferase HypF [Candidatus Omnitrophica bacterium]|nr:carbamoyltransferase HypF [Candidatus Omnitrophota bacterium]